MQPRIDAALAAGGALVGDAEAPSFWVLADAEGDPGVPVHVAAALKVDRRGEG